MAQQAEEIKNGMDRALEQAMSFDKIQEEDDPPSLEPTPEDDRSDLMTTKMVNNNKMKTMTITRNAHTVVNNTFPTQKMSK